MFRDEVARCAVLAGRLRMLCRFGITDDDLKSEALDLCAELEDILERPADAHTDDQRAKWAKQKRDQRAKRKSARTSADSPRTTGSSSGGSGGGSPPDLSSTTSPPKPPPGGGSTVKLSKRDRAAAQKAAHGPGQAGGDGATRTISMIRALAERGVAEGDLEHVLAYLNSNPSAWVLPAEIPKQGDNHAASPS